MSKQASSGKTIPELWVRMDDGQWSMFTNADFEILDNGQLYIVHAKGETILAKGYWRRIRFE